MKEDAHIKPSQKGIKKPSRRRNKPGSKALREIKYYQKTDTPLIRRAPFKRLVKEIFAGFNSYRLRKKALELLHVLVEDYAIRLFKGAQIEAIHAKRKTIMVKDMKTVRRIMTVMHGEADLDADPINPEFSEAHRKECNAKRRKSRPRKRKEPVVLVPANLSLHDVDDNEEEIDVVHEMDVMPTLPKEPVMEAVVEIVVEREEIRSSGTLAASVEVNDDDWLQ